MSGGGLLDTFSTGCTSSETKLRISGAQQTTLDQLGAVNNQLRDVSGRSESHYPRMFDAFQGHFVQLQQLKHGLASLELRVEKCKRRAIRLAVFEREREEGTEQKMNNNPAGQ